MIRPGMAGALGLACVGLAAVILAELAAGPGRAGPYAAPLPLPARAAASRREDPARLAATALGRPLFVPGRRPPAAADSDAAPQALPRLSGTLLVSGERAAILEPDGGKPVVVRQGGSLEGWTVGDIGEGRVTLTRAGERQSIALRYLAAAAAPPAAPEPLGGLRTKWSDPHLAP